MTDLALPAASVTGLLAWQSLIHIPDGAIPAVIEGFHRTLRPGGALHLLFHVDDEPWPKTEGYGGHPMKVWVHPRQPSRVGGWLRDAGFTVDAELQLAPHSARPQAFLPRHQRARPRLTSSGPAPSPTTVPPEVLDRDRLPRVRED